MPANQPPPGARDDVTKLVGRLRYFTGMPRVRLREMLAAAERPSNVVPIRLRGGAATALDLEAEEGAAPAAWIEALPVRVPAPLTFGLRAEGDEIIARVHIRSSCTRERLEQLGARVRSLVGDITTAEAPLSAMDRLAAEPGVASIELSRPGSPLLDHSVPEIQADQLHHAHPEVRGAGVVIGVIDVDGIDLWHPDLCEGAGGELRTRITHLWDQRVAQAPGAAGAVPGPWGYGVEYTREDIDRDLASGAPGSIVAHRPDVPPGGRPGHGTHMAGIAAGNGRGGRGEYTGVAPEAEIIFVNTLDSGTRGLADMTAVCDAIQYIFDRAGDRPCVVNLSMGDNLGPHDGTSAVERLIDRAVEAPGRAVVVAAGNGNDLGQHLEFEVPPAGAASLELFIPRDTRFGEAVEIWYPRDDRLEITIRPPNGADPGPVIHPGDVASMDIGLTQVHVVSTVHDSRNGDNVIELLLEPGALVGRMADGVWRLDLRRSEGCAPPAGPRPCHAWIDGSTRISWKNPTRDRGTLTTPATARGAIAVGNTMSRVGGAISATSGCGPTRDGRRKPDFGAPGSGIKAPLASATPGRHEALYEHGCGTSQAAAHVTGLCALLFQCHGSRTHVAALRSILARHADRSGMSGRWEPGLGHGRVRAAGTCSALALVEVRGGGDPTAARPLGPVFHDVN
ncbi:MAG: S8 family serine peptidase [Polyangiaceae bacterium]|nr:S8 family serine peptidase [Polyangiaceae bacterium]